MRPSNQSKNLAEMFAKVATPSEFGYALQDFLDCFSREPDPRLVADEPALLTMVFDDEGLFDAYLASVAAWVCRMHALPAPTWTRGAARAVQAPWFASQEPSLKRKYLVESPSEFRVRNLFVSANALSRA